MKARQELVETFAPWGAGLLLAAPVLIAYYPPTTDLPFHEAAIGVLRHFRDDSMFPEGLYRLNLGEPNQLFHMLGWALSYVTGTRWAAKVVVAASIVAIPACAARFARYIGASPLAALAVAPIALGWLFSFGLVANLLGLGSLLFVLPVLHRFVLTPSARGAMKTCACLLLLYFAHEAMMLVYLGIAFALALLLPWSWKTTARRLTPSWVGLVLILVNTRWQEQFVTPTVRSVPLSWHPLLHKLRRIPYMVLPVADDVVQLSMFALCLFVIGSFFWLRTRERRERLAVPARTGSRVRALAIERPWLLVAMGCFGAYVVLPFTISGWSFVYERWFPPGFAILAIAATPRDLWTRAALLPRLALGAVPVATLLVALPSFVDSSRQYRALEPIIEAIEPGSAVASISLGAPEAWREYSLYPAAGRALATRGGRLAYAFTDTPVSPVVIDRRYQWNEALRRVGFDPWALRPAHDLRYFRYLVVRTTDRAVMQLAAIALRPEARYVLSSGEWALFESRLPVVPLLSREEPMENPPPETLRERVDPIGAASVSRKGPRTLLGSP